jgi:hypothetical protein
MRLCFLPSGNQTHGCYKKIPDKWRKPVTMGLVWRWYSREKTRVHTSRLLFFIINVIFYWCLSVCQSWCLLLKKIWFVIICLYRAVPSTCNVALLYGNIKWLIYEVHDITFGGDTPPALMWCHDKTHWLSPSAIIFSHNRARQQGQSCFDSWVDLAV